MGSLVIKRCVPGWNGKLADSWLDGADSDEFCAFFVAHVDGKMVRMQISCESSQRTNSVLRGRVKICLTFRTKLSFLTKKRFISQSSFPWATYTSANVSPKFWPILTNRISRVPENRIVSERRFDSLSQVSFHRTISPS